MALPTGPHLHFEFRFRQAIASGDGAATLAEGLQVVRGYFYVGLAAVVLPEAPLLQIRVGQYCFLARAARTVLVVVVRLACLRCAGYDASEELVVQLEDTNLGLRLGRFDWFPYAVLVDLSVAAAFVHPRHRDDSFLYVKCAVTREGLNAARP